MATVEVLPHRAIAAKETALQQGLEHVADIEEMMQMMQKEGVTTKAKPVCPHPRIIKKDGVIDKFAPPSAGTKGKLTGVETEEIEEGTAAAEEDPDVIITKPKKSLKTTLLCDAIKTVKQERATEKAQINKGTTHGDGDGTIQVINNWAADTGKSRGAPQALHGSAGVSATLPPPSTLSRLSGSTKATSVSHYIPTAPPPTPTDLDILVGDENLSDDNQERRAAITLVEMRLGKPLVQNIVQIVSINEDTRMDIQERSSLTQNLKCKEPDPDYVSTSEVEFSEEEIAGDVESDLEPRVSHKVWMTMETLVTILAMPSHGVKKAKVEPHIK
ncbi:hypothetical protein PAXRUDRAFT_28957, partial [Paxillus rubicundulus Ve08.2h10]